MSADRQATITLKPELLDVLSKADDKLLVLISNGFTHKEAANSLDITEAAARGRIHRVYKKLGVDTAAQATRIAIKSGLVKI